MWSERFLWAGVTSSVIAAVITLFCVLLLFFWLESWHGDWDFSRAFYSLISPLSVMYLVYAACWYFLIFRPRTYSIARTSILVSCIYPISCGLIAAILYGLIFAPGGAWTAFFGFNSLAHFFHFLFRIVIWASVGFVFYLIPYILIAFPMAYLQRFLLLWLFRPATR